MAGTPPMNVFDVAGRAMSAQMVRMNTAASNLANAGTVSGSERDAYRPLRPVFAEDLNRANGLSTVKVNGVYRTDASPIRTHDPDNPLADANGDVLLYRWVLTYKPSGSSATLSSATAARPTFVADTVGVYVATLVVNDGRLDSNQVTIAITAAAP
jgi:hypothetical protein